MRFVFITCQSESKWGGSEELWSQTALRLHGEGHHVSAAVVWWPELSPKVSNLARQGIELFMQRTAWSALPRRVWNKLRQTMGGLRPKFAWLLSQKPDLVVLSQGGPGDCADWLKFCRTAKLPFVVILHCNHDTFWLPGNLGREMAEAYRTARTVFFVSQHNRKMAERQIGGPLTNAVVVWNPINVPPIQPPAWPAEQDGWKFGCVARLDIAAKGHDLLFEVLSRPEWRNRSVEVNLYGTGKCETALKQLAGRLQLSRVHFHGHLADVAGIWGRNHLLILPSRYEGLPLALLESMWCGRPAVVTNVGGNAEACVDGETGFVAPAANVELLAQAMETAWECRDQWRKMGEAARARAEKLIPVDPVGDFCQQLKAPAG